jgi:hypothetical protein
MLKLGTTEINKLYLGSTEMKKVYLGSTLFYDKSFVTLEGFESISGNLPNTDWIWSHEGAVTPTLSAGPLIEAGVPEGSQSARFSYTPTENTVAILAAGGTVTATDIDLSMYTSLAVDVFFNQAGDFDVVTLIVADSDGTNEITESQPYDAGDGVTITLDLTSKVTRTDVVVGLAIDYNNDFSMLRTIDFDNLRGLP